MRTRQFRRFGALLACVTASSAASVQAETLAELRAGTHFHGIAFARDGSGKVLLATHNGLFALETSGTAVLLSPVQDLMGFAPDPSQAETYYSSGHPEGGGNSGLEVSTDGGRSWDMISEGLGGPVDFHQMTVSAADPSRVYGAYGDIQRSRDGGRSWEKAGPAPQGMIALAADRRDPDRVYAATEAGLAASLDAGSTWATVGLKGEVVSLAAPDSAGRVVVYVVGKGFALAASAEDGTVTDVAPLSNPKGNGIPLHLAIDPDDPRHWISATNKNVVIETSDGGLSWSRFGAGE